MKTHITGYRNDAEWPPVGGEIDLPDLEAGDLEAAGYAQIIGQATPAAGEDVALEAMTAKALRAAADAAGIEIPKRMKRKDDLVAHITAELAAKAAEEDPDEGSASDPGTGQPDASGPDGPPAGDGPDATSPAASPGPGAA
jgi:hypothetical protein